MNMDYKILLKLQNVQLTDEKDEPTTLEEEDVCQGVEEYFSSCLGRIYKMKDYPLRVLQRLLKNIWKIEKLRVAEIRTNTVQIFFPNLEGMKKILKGVYDALTTTYWLSRDGIGLRNFLMNLLTMSSIGST